MAFSFILACIILNSCLVAGQSQIYALRGKEVNLTPDISGQPDHILWKHNGNKVVEFNGNQEQVCKRFMDRINLNWHTAELQITELTLEDSGDYELEASVNMKLYESFSQLKVIDRVPVPTISCEMNNGTSYNKSATLQCSIQPRQKSIQIQWTSHGSVESGATLRINLGDSLDEEEYTCRVSNALSSETASFSAKGCYSDKSSSVALITSLAIVAAVVLLVSVFGVVFCKWKHKACFAEEAARSIPRHFDRVSSRGSSQTEESIILLGRETTLPSTQRLPPQELLGIAKAFEPATNHSPSSPPAYESPSGLARDKDEHNKGVAEPDRLRAPVEEDGSNVPDPDAEGRAASASSLEPPTAAEIPVSTSELEEDTDDDDQVNPTSHQVAPPAQPSSLDAPNVAPTNSAGEPDKGSNSDQCDGKDPTSIRDSDSSGIGKSNQAKYSSDEELSAATPEEKASDTTQDEEESAASPGEAQSDEDKQREKDSLSENESDGVSHHEGCEEPGVCLANTQSPRTANASQETDEEDEEPKTRDSDQVTEDESECVENRNKSDPKEEKPGHGEPR